MIKHRKVLLTKIHYEPELNETTSYTMAGQGKHKSSSFQYYRVSLIFHLLFSRMLSSVPYSVGKIKSK